MLVEQCRFRGRRSVRTKFLEPEIDPTRTGLFHETEVVISALTPSPEARHIRGCDPLITASHAPGTPERLF